MTITLPDIPDAPSLSPAEVRLELACALYARGRIGKVTAAEYAGVDFFTFQRALGERGISTYTDEALANDLQSLKELFPP
jgi:predicted HTH domain antitoxin